MTLPAVPTTDAKPPRLWACVGLAPAVVLGRSQRGLSTQPGLRVQRRSSGGGAVLTGPWMLEAMLRLPRQHPLASRGPVETARWFGQVHLQWLQERGIQGAALHEGRSTSHWSCFAGLGPGEVLVQGRKLTGIAQTWRRHHIHLSSGTLLYPPPWVLLCEVLGRPPGDAAGLQQRASSAQECLGRPVSPADWLRSLRRAIDRAVDAAQPALTSPPGSGPR